MSGDCLNHAGDKRSCTKYQQTIKDDKFQQAEQAREKGIAEIQRLEFYIEKFASNERDAKHALSLTPFIKDHIQTLHKEKSFPHSELKFLEECLLLLVQCRQTLKWTYAYAYYFINERNKNAKLKKELFEYCQTDLENFTQKLHT